MGKRIHLLTAILVMGWAGLSAQSIQKVVIEEFTGAWCGYCPDGALILEDVLTQQPNAIAMSIHNGDGMVSTVGGQIEGFYNPAFPQAVFNRGGAPVSRGSWGNAAASALQNEPVVSVAIDSAGFDFLTRTLKVKVKATFHRDTTGMLRLGGYLTEDDVVGSGSGYNQVNYYNTTQGHPLQGLGNPILNYTHNHVFRDALGGAWGLNGSLPDTVFAGDEFSYTFTKVFSSTNTWDKDKMHIIGTVHMHGGSFRPILNAEEVPFSIATSITAAPTAGPQMEVYPNPFSTRTTIGFQVEETGRIVVELFDLTGKRLSILADDVANAGMHSVYWDGTDSNGQRLSAGMYLVRLRTEAGVSISKRVMLAGN